MAGEHTQKHCDVAEVVAEAVCVWQKAQTVLQAAYWSNGPEPLKYVECLRKLPDSETALQQLLEHPNRFVAAYALCTLGAMKSQSLRELPPGLLERRDRLTLVVGSFSNVTTLGDFARRVRKEAIGASKP